MPIVAACVSGGDVYINGVAQGWGNRMWLNVVVTRSGDVWATCGEVDGVYKNGVAQGWPNDHGQASWTALVAHGDDVYAGQNWDGVPSVPAYVYKNGVKLSEWP
ncbi:hypothetical protein, partial [Pseudodesulfovibrio pelocollis]|uniref:hypothetical protein n=1 Tax=Pseudodesulfovibrio pelocollis TaxID=3051432 RepID=UPI00255A7776